MPPASFGGRVRVKSSDGTGSDDYNIKEPILRTANSPNRVRSTVEPDPPTPTRIGLDHQTGPPHKPPFANSCFERPFTSAHITAGRYPALYEAADQLELYNPDHVIDLFQAFHDAGGYEWDAKAQTSCEVDDPKIYVHRVTRPAHIPSACLRGPSIFAAKAQLKRGGGRQDGKPLTWSTWWLIDSRQSSTTSSTQNCAHQPQSRAVCAC